MPPGRLRIAATALTAAALTVAPAASASDKTTVKITGNDDASYAFSPDKVRVDKGTTVHWSWHSNEPHNVTFTDLGQESDTADTGTYQLKFKKAGTFKYICSVHGFKGKVIVG